VNNPLMAVVDDLRDRMLKAREEQGYQEELSSIATFNDNAGVEHGADMQKEYWTGRAEGLRDAMEDYGGKSTFLQFAVSEAHERGAKRAREYAAAQGMTLRPS